MMGGMMGGRKPPMAPPMPMGEMEDEGMAMAAPPPMMGAHAALGERITMDPMMSFNPVLSAPEFDVASLGPEFGSPSPMGMGMASPMGAPMDPIDGQFNDMQKPDVRAQMIEFLQNKAKSRLAATEKFQSAALDARNPKQPQ